MAKRRGAAVSTAAAVGLVLVALAGNLLANRLAHAHLAAGLLLVASLIAISAAAGLTPLELGLARTTWARGLRWGVTAAALVAVCYVALAALPGLRDAIPESVDATWRATLGAAFVLIPFGTVLPEELAFRGVLWSLLTERWGNRVATLVSSGLFGVWHMFPAVGGRPVNQAVKGIVGSDPTAITLLIIGTVSFTAAAGVLLCELRRRSDSLFAPILLHWAVNGLGAIFVMVT